MFYELNLDGNLFKGVTAGRVSIIFYNDEVGAITVDTVQAPPDRLLWERVDDVKCTADVDDPVTGSRMKLAICNDDNGGYRLSGDVAAVIGADHELVAMTAGAYNIAPWIARYGDRGLLYFWKWVTCGIWIEMFGEQFVHVYADVVRSELLRPFTN